MFPAASAGAEYVMFCAPSDDVYSHVIEAGNLGKSILPNYQIWLTPPICIAVSFEYRIR